MLRVTHGIFRIALPFPPLPEQERIAAYLDASCAAIDAAVAAKRRQLETLDATSQSTLARRHGIDSVDQGRHRVGSGIRSIGVAEALNPLVGTSWRSNGLRLDQDSPTAPTETELDDDDVRTALSNGHRST